MNTRFYAEMMGATLRGLPKGSLPGAQVRFMRGIDEDADGGSYLLCVAAGTPPGHQWALLQALREDREAEPRAVVGCIRYADGRIDGPTPVIDAARDALLRDVGLTA